VVASKNSPARVNATVRRAQAIQLRIEGKTLDQIAVALGYKSRGAVSQDISRALAAQITEPAAELRSIEAARLDAAWQRLDDARERVMDVLTRKHITVSNGKVITLPGADDKPVPLEDDGPILAAVGRLLDIERSRLQIMERRAKLFGLDAPAKVSVITDEALDEELARAAAELAELERATRSEAGETEGDPAEDD
jgi:hypothetical protein